MLTLILLRHAKSSWDDAELDDFERPLAARGLIAAPAIGAYLASHNLRPDLILCSGAARTRATLGLVQPFLGAPPAVAFEDALYLASASDLMTRIKRIPSKWPKVMMIGHNPGFHTLFKHLTATSDPTSNSALMSKFPTCALAVLTFPFQSWLDIGPGIGHLTHFTTPSRLAKLTPSASIGD
jgi:phosphohistidine phosphatase